MTHGWQVVHHPFTLDPVISAGELRALGITAQMIPGLVKRGSLIPLSRGWYATTAPTTAAQRHQLLTTAAVRSFQDRCVPSHYSALLQAGLPLYNADVTTVHLARVDRGNSISRPGLVVHRPVPPGAVVRPEMRLDLGLAIAQTGITCGPIAALIAADAALHRRLVTPPDISQGLDWIRGHPGTGQLDTFLQLADGSSESPGETRLRHVFHLMRCPVVPQSWIRDGAFAARVDFELVDARVIVEFDGLVKYGSSVTRPGEPDGRHALIAEKQREDRLRELGYDVVRVTWRDLDDPASLSRRINAAIARSRARHGSGVRGPSLA